MVAWRTMKWILAAAVVLVLSVAGVVWLGWKSTVGRASNGTMMDSIPDVLQGQIIEHAFIVTNDGPNDLVIVDAVPWASTIVSVDSVIPPHGSGKVRVRIDTKRWHGALSELVKVHFTDPQRRSAWLQLKSRVVLPVELEPHDAVYFFAVRGDAPPQAIQVVSYQQRPLALLDVQSSDPAFHVRSRAIQDGRRYEIMIALDTAVAVGEHRGTITVRTDSPESPTLNIQALAKVKDIVNVSIPAISFSTFALESIDLEAVYLRTVVVEKHRATDFRVVRATTDLAQVRVDVVPEKPGQSYLVRVRLIPERIKRGMKFEGTLIIETNDPMHPRLEVPISGAVA